MIVYQMAHDLSDNEQRIPFLVDAIIRDATHQPLKRIALLT
jgi:hypothetical protein